MGLFDSFFPTATPDNAQAAPAPQDNGQIAYQYFVNNGYAPHQAAGIVGNLQGESGQGLNPNAVNRGDGRDGSDSIGIAQWNGERAQALKQYAANRGTSPNDLTTQLGFLHSELRGPESAAGARLAAAQTPEEAGRAMLAFERPKDWNVAGAHPERAQYAARAFSMYGGQTPSMARAGPLNAIPQSASPIFPQQQAQAQPQQVAQADPGLQLEPPPQMQPLFAPQRKPINLSALRAAFKQPQFFRG